MADFFSMNEFEHELEQRAREFIGSCTARAVFQLPAAEQSANSEAVACVDPQDALKRQQRIEFLKDCQRVLIKACEEPAKTLSGISEDLDLTTNRMQGCLTYHTAKKFVIRHTYARSGRGGRPSVLEVTEDGVRFLNDFGIKPQPLAWRGGFDHEIGMRMSKRELKGSAQVYTDRRIGDKDYDVTGVLMDGRVVAVEVICSGSAEHNAEALGRGIVQAGISELWAVCCTKELRDAVRETMEARKHPEFDKIEWKLIGDLFPKRTPAKKAKKG